MPCLSVKVGSGEQAGAVDPDGARLIVAVGTGTVGDAAVAVDRTVAGVQPELYWRILRILPNLLTVVISSWWTPYGQDKRERSELLARNMGI